MLVAELFQSAIFNLHPVWMGGHSLAEWRTRNPHWTRFPTAKRRGRGTRTCPELWWSRRTRETSRALRRPWSGAWSRPRGSATGRRFRAMEGSTWWPGKMGSQGFESCHENWLKVSFQMTYPVPIIFTSNGRGRWLTSSTKLMTFQTKP